MNRRTALKNLTLSIGYAVAAPSLFNMLASCTSETATWKPVFFSLDEKLMVTHLVDIILPASNIPGALDVNVPEFIDKMYKEIELAPKQKIFQNGAAIFAENFKDKYGKNISKGSKEEIKTLFSSYFDLSPEAQQLVIQEQRKAESEINENNKASFLMYQFLFSVRYYTLFGYYTSKKVGTEVLNYDPVPGVYKGCIPVEEVGNAWTL
ncbi:MAG: gluconate 2-dehydrogenase subunit 3 family protein [Lutibacter sp.]|nr:gluconate 2-dehydrogenase subunit 3 family protein [Lutibacter sp.]